MAWLGGQSRSLRWGAWFLYGTLAVRTVFRPLLNAGHALALCGVVATTALVLKPRLSHREQAAWCALLLALLGAEVREALVFHKAEETFVVGRVSPEGSMTLERKGTALLRGLTMRVIDPDDLHALHARHSDDVEDYRAVVQTVQLGSFGEANIKHSAVHPVLPHGGKLRYQIFFNADSGGWWEAIELQQQHGRWLQAIRIWRYRDLYPVLIYQSTDPALAVSANGADWQWGKDLL